MIFVILILYILLVNYLCRCIAPHKKLLYCILVACAFILISGLRSKFIGVDTISYVKTFLKSSPFTWAQFLNTIKKPEFLFYTYRMLVRTVTEHYTLFLFPIAVWYVSCVTFFIYKYSSYPMISYLLFLSMGYFFLSMAGLRQIIGMAFLLLALDKLIQKKHLLCLLLIVIASCFQITSLAFLVIYLINLLPLNKWYLIGIGALTGASYILGAGALLQVVNMVWGNTRGYVKIEYGGISTYILLILISICVLVFYPHILSPKRSDLLLVPGGYIKHCREKKPILELKGFITDQLFFKMLLFSIPIQLLAIYQANVFRIAMMYHIAVLALIPNTISRQKDRATIILTMIVITVLLMIQFFVFTYGAKTINPFHFFWETP